jgi:hypothetical protein
MRDRLHLDPTKTARILVWAALSGMLLWWLRWGSEVVAIYSYYRIRHSVRYIWDQFYEELPEVGNATALDAVYWLAVAVMVAGVLALFWLALAPDESEADATRPVAARPDESDGHDPIVALE